jgi:hypothetical protein
MGWRGDEASGNGDIARRRAENSVDPADGAVCMQHAALGGAKLRDFAERVIRMPSQCIRSPACGDRLARSRRNGSRRA